MPLRIKIYLGLFTTVAVLIVTGAVLDFKNLSGLEARVAQVIGIDAKTGKLINDPSKPSDDPFEGDIDKDGIKDELESIYNTSSTNPDTDGDGFLDGEEVASGCDPLDGDREKDCPESYGRYFKKFEEEDKNLTRELAALVAGGMDTGDLETSNPEFYENLQELQLKAVDDSDKLFSIDSNEHNIIVSDDNSFQAIEEYLINISNLLSKDITEALPKKQLNIIFEGLGEENIKNNEILLKYLTTYELAYTKALQITVPSSWLEVHKDLLDLLKKNALIFSSLVKSYDDPIRALSAVVEFKNLTSDYQNLINKIGEKYNSLSEEL